MLIIRPLKNNLCTGRRIIIHPMEPEDDPSKPIRLLRFPPLAIIVQPDGEPIGDVCKSPEIPVHCIPVRQSTTTKFTHDACQTCLCWASRGVSIAIAYSPVVSHGDAWQVKVLLTFDRCAISGAPLEDLSFAVSIAIAHSPVVSRCYCGI